MSYRTVEGSNYRLYDAGADVEANEQELVKIMFIVGLGNEDINIIALDTILGAIDSTFNYDDRAYLKVDETNFYSFPQTASNDIIKKTNSHLTTVVRRLWRWRHLAQYQGTL